MSRDYEYDKMMEDIDRQDRINRDIYMMHYEQSKMDHVPLFASGERGHVGKGRTKKSKYKTRKKKSR